MTKTTPTTREKFEANMLDGDPVNDCGGCMISAEACLEYLESQLSELAGKMLGVLIDLHKDHSLPDYRIAVLQAYNKQLKLLQELGIKI